MLHIANYVRDIILLCSKIDKEFLFIERQISVCILKDLKQEDMGNQSSEPFLILR